MPDAAVVNISTRCTAEDARAGATPSAPTMSVLAMTPKAMPSAPSTSCAANPTAMKGSSPAQSMLVSQSTQVAFSLSCPSCARARNVRQQR
jgi:hypothetical protein